MAKIGRIAVVRRESVLKTIQKDEVYSCGRHPLIRVAPSLLRDETMASIDVVGGGFAFTSAMREVRGGSTVILGSQRRGHRATGSGERVVLRFKTERTG